MRGDSAALLSLLPTDVLPHPLRDAHHTGLVGLDAAPLAELVGPVRRRHPAARELAVPRDQQQRHVTDRGARLDEALDAFAGLDEVREVRLVLAARGADAGGSGASGVTGGTLVAGPASTATKQVHGE